MRIADFDYDFTRCRTCQRLGTRLELARALAPGGSGLACPCGGLQVSPANLPWYGWLLPRVWTFAVARLRGQA